MSTRQVAAIVAAAAMTFTWQGASPAGTLGASGQAPSTRGATAVFDTPERVAHSQHKGGIPAMVIDRSGTVTAVWRQTYVGAGGTKEYAMRAARRGPGGHWTAARTIACPRPGTCADHHVELGVDSQGAVTAAWASSAGVMVVRRPAGGPWGKPLQFTATTSRWNVGLAVSGSGAVFLTWVDHGNVWVAHRTRTGSWSTPQLVESAISYAAKAAAWPGGSAILGYTRERGRFNVDAVVRTFVPGSGWSAAKVLGNGDLEAVAVGPRHSAVCMWGGGARVRFSDLRNGRWRSPVSFGSRYVGWRFGSALAMDRAGNEFAGWIEYGDGAPNVGFVASKPAGGAWSRRMFFGPTPAFEGWPIVAQANGANDALAVFPRRTLFRPHGQAWTPPLKFGAKSGVILHSGALLRMWWRDDGLVAQRVHLR